MGVAVDPRMTVAELLGAYPEAAKVFAGFGMGCVGCDMAAFDTLAMVAATYRVSWETFAAQLAAAVAEASTASSTSASPRA